MYLHSEQHYSRWPNGGKNPDVHQLVNGRTNVASRCNKVSFGKKEWVTTPATAWGALRTVGARHEKTRACDPSSLGFLDSSRPLRLGVKGSPNFFLLYWRGEVFYTGTGLALAIFSLSLKPLMSAP